MLKSEIFTQCFLFILYKRLICFMLLFKFLIQSLLLFILHFNFSNSLSSLESEEQDSIALAERRRSSRNSTGGISTHSLNEAELAVNIYIQLISTVIKTFFCSEIWSA